MQDDSACPQCSGANPYFDGNIWNCPDCGHEWTAHSLAQDAQKANQKANQKTNQKANQKAEQESFVRDAHGNVLHDGDSVTVIKDLKIKGSSNAVKVGTKVKNIRLIDSSDGHNIACKIDGFGALNLKSEFVKKAEP